MDFYSTAAFIVYAFSAFVSVSVVSYYAGRAISKYVRKAPNEAKAAEAEMKDLERAVVENRQMRDIYFKKVMIVIFRELGPLYVPVHIGTARAGQLFYYWGKGNDRGAYHVNTSRVRLILKLPILPFDVSWAEPVQFKLTKLKDIPTDENGFARVHEPLVLTGEVKHAQLIDLDIEKEATYQGLKAAKEETLPADSRLLRTILFTGILVAIPLFLAGWFFGSVVPITNFIHFNMTKSAVILAEGLI